MFPATVRNTSSSCKTTADIDFSRHRLKVYHIDALTDPTEMVKVQAFGDRPNLRGIRPTVCSDFLPLVFKPTVSL